MLYQVSKETGKPFPGTAPHSTRAIHRKTYHHIICVGYVRLIAYFLGRSYPGQQVLGVCYV